MIIEVIIVVGVFVLLFVILGAAAYWVYRGKLRRAKGVERGLKMVPVLIHLPPASDDTSAGGRDVREIMREKIAQAEVLYDLVASTATSGFKSTFYGQRHIAFELVASGGLIHFYAAVPVALVDVVKQAVLGAYPGARLEEVEDHNIFNQDGKLATTGGGELILKSEAAFPLATYKNLERDPMEALLNALSGLGQGEGAAVQIMLRPARPSWAKDAAEVARKKRKNRQSDLKFSAADLVKAAVKAPEQQDPKNGPRELTSLELSTVEAIEEKTRHKGYETLIRVVASTGSQSRTQAVLRTVVSCFSLYELPGLNGFKYLPAVDVQGIVNAFIFRFFPPEVSSSILNTQELATLFHLPDSQFVSTSNVARQESKQVDGPVNVVATGLLFGHNQYRGVSKEIRLSPEDRRRHTYILGQTGTGKSTMLENLAVQDMLSGGGFAFIDPHGDSAEKLLSMVPRDRAEDIIYFNPADTSYPLGLNLFEFTDPAQKDFLVQETIGMLYKLYDPNKTGIIGPRYEHWYRNAALTLMSDPDGSTFIEIPKVFTDTEYLKRKFRHLNDQTVIEFWTKEMGQTSDYHKSEMLGWFVSKFGAFMNNEMMRNIIGQTKSSFDLRQVMDEGKILIVNLSKGRIGELNSQLLGMMFVIKFQAAAMARASTPEEQRRDFCLYVDEFQNFSTDSFASILSEARKYRLNLIVANQFISQLSPEIRDAVFGNIGTIVAHRMGPEDAEFMTKQFAPVFDARDLVGMPNHHAAMRLMLGGVPSQPFTIADLPPLGVSNRALGEAVKELSAAKFGRSRAQVEADIFARMSGTPAVKAAPSGPAAPAPAPVPQPALSVQAAAEPPAGSLPQPAAPTPLPASRPASAAPASEAVAPARPAAVSGPTAPVAAVPAVPPAHVSDSLPSVPAPSPSAGAVPASASAPSPAALTVHDIIRSGGNKSSVMPDVRAAEPAVAAEAHGEPAAPPSGAAPAPAALTSAVSPASVLPPVTAAPSRDETASIQTLSVPQETPGTIYEAQQMIDELLGHSAGPGRADAEPPVKAEPVSKAEMTAEAAPAPVVKAEAEPVSRAGSGVNPEPPAASSSLKHDRAPIDGISPSGEAPGERVRIAPRPRMQGSPDSSKTAQNHPQAAGDHTGKEGHHEGRGRRRHKKVLDAVGQSDSGAPAHEGLTAGVAETGPAAAAAPATATPSREVKTATAVPAPAPKEAAAPAPRRSAVIPPRNPLAALRRQHHSLSHPAAANVREETRAVDEAPAPVSAEVLNPAVETVSIPVVPAPASIVSAAPVAAAEEALSGAAAASETQAAFETAAAPEIQGAPEPVPAPGAAGPNAEAGTGVDKGSPAAEEAPQGPVDWARAAVDALAHAEERETKAEARPEPAIEEAAKPAEAERQLSDGREEPADAGNDIGERIAEKIREKARQGVLDPEAAEAMAGRLKKSLSGGGRKRLPDPSAEVKVESEAPSGLNPGFGQEPEGRILHHDSNLAGARRALPSGKPDPAVEASAAVETGTPATGVPAPEAAPEAAAGGEPRAGLENAAAPAASGAEDKTSSVPAAEPAAESAEEEAVSASAQEAAAAGMERPAASSKEAAKNPAAEQMPESLPSVTQDEQSKDLIVPDPIDSEVPPPAAPAARETPEEPGAESEDAATQPFSVAGQVFMPSELRADAAEVPSGGREPEAVLAGNIPQLQPGEIFVDDDGNVHMG